MGKRKEKIRPLKAWQFLLGWLVAHALWSVGNNLLSAFLLASGLAYAELPSLTLFNMPINLLLTLFVSVLEFWLLRRFLQKTPRFWVQAQLAATFLGSITMLGFFSMTQVFTFDAYTISTLMSLLHFAIFAAVEWLILRRYVRYAWLWIPATIGAVLFRNILWQLMGAAFMTQAASFGLSLASTVGSNLVLGLSIMLMVFLSRRSDNILQDSDVDEDDDNNYGRLADDASDPHADKAPLVQRRAQSY